MISTVHSKVFKCPVHEYISVPRDIVTAFIDTPIFQRLRRIEQTCMRPLYPSAHHDRFSHSLGVFHLASIAFHHIEKNTKVTLLGDVNLKDYRWAFCIAALMHDCAHAPFSHTFEDYYQRSDYARDFLFSELDEESKEEFKKDYGRRERSSKGPSAHEIFSAAIFLKHFRDTFQSIIPTINPSLVARMITGLIFTEANEIRKQIENSLIMLIHGSAIDVDKLDYVIRDTWASGICNVRIDTTRLLSALCIDKYCNRLVPSFHKSALSVIQNVVDGRNFLYRWIYTHHTVCYFDHLLQEAGKKLFRIMAPPESQEDFVDAVFSKDVFEKNIESCNVNLYLPCDGDLIYLMKQHRDDIPEIDELLSRKPKLVPLWKTRSEFDYIFKTQPTTDQQEDIRERFRDIISSVIEDQEQLDSVLCIRTKPRIVEIDEASVYVTIMEEVRPFTALLTRYPRHNTEDNAFFYIFIPRECEYLKKSCISKMRSAIAY